MVVKKKKKRERKKKEKKVSLHGGLSSKERAWAHRKGRERGLGGAKAEDSCRCFCRVRAAASDNSSRRLGKHISRDNRN